MIFLSYYAFRCYLKMSRTLYYIFGVGTHTALRASDYGKVQKLCEGLEAYGEPSYQIQVITDKELLKLEDVQMTLDYQFRVYKPTCSTRGEWVACRPFGGTFEEQGGRMETYYSMAHDPLLELPGRRKCCNQFDRNCTCDDQPFAPLPYLPNDILTYILRLILKSSLTYVGGLHYCFSHLRLIDRRWLSCSNQAIQQVYSQIPPAGSNPYEARDYNDYQRFVAFHNKLGVVWAEQQLARTKQEKKETRVKTKKQKEQQDGWQRPTRRGHHGR